MQTKTQPASENQGAPPVGCADLLGLTFVAEHSNRKAEWEIISEVLMAENGTKFVWVKPIRRIRAMSKWKDRYVWPINLLANVELRRRYDPDAGMPECVTELEQEGGGGND